MNQDIKAEWLKRLKSGDYKQGTAFLCSGDEHCCLGVLAEIAVERGVCSKMLSPNGPQMPARYTDNEDYTSATLLPGALLAWAGLNWDTEHALTKANDGACDGRYTAVIPLIEAL